MSKYINALLTTAILIGCGLLLSVTANAISLKQFLPSRMSNYAPLLHKVGIIGKDDRVPRKTGDIPDWAEASQARIYCDNSGTINRSNRGKIHGLNDLAGGDEVATATLAFEADLAIVSRHVFSPAKGDKHDPQGCFIQVLKTGEWIPIDKVAYTEVADDIKQMGLDGEDEHDFAIVKLVRTPRGASFVPSYKIWVNFPRKLGDWLRVVSNYAMNYKGDLDTPTITTCRIMLFFAALPSQAGPLANATSTDCDTGHGSSGASIWITKDGINFFVGVNVRELGYGKDGEPWDASKHSEMVTMFDDTLLKLYHQIKGDHITATSDPAADKATINSPTYNYAGSGIAAVVANPPSPEPKPSNVNLPNYVIGSQGRIHCARDSSDVRAKGFHNASELDRMKFDIWNATLAYDETHAISVYAGFAAYLSDNDVNMKSCLFELVKTGELANIEAISPSYVPMKWKDTEVVDKLQQNFAVIKLASAPQGASFVPKQFILIAHSHNHSDFGPSLGAKIYLKSKMVVTSNNALGVGSGGSMNSPAIAECQALHVMQAPAWEGDKVSNILQTDCKAGPGTEGSGVWEEVGNNYNLIGVYSIGEIPELGLRYIATTFDDNLSAEFDSVSKNVRQDLIWLSKQLKP